MLVDLDPDGEGDQDLTYMVREAMDNAAVVDEWVIMELGL